MHAVLTTRLIIHGQHFHGRYFTGEVSDCNSQRCKTSKSHMHKTAPNCGCPTVRPFHSAPIFTNPYL
ncbi:hypothetical protein JVT61DRAFT_4713 [Boletus reticuloceps]|uniref:Uncharacterized protein n=1 Tax=Boletus reticuloceps TaxID=495285 RepID=A0A8I2YLZ6_9AGAM|nr:hypothetical protein JVT61DRAFT_4713 [Boletus reticuloceps]